MRTLGYVLGAIVRILVGVIVIVVVAWAIWNLLLVPAYYVGQSIAASWQNQAKVLVPPPAPYVPPAAPPAAPPADPPAGPSTNCLTIAQFQAMWTTSSPAQGPGPLIQTLNNAFDMSGGHIGTQWPNGPMTVEPMSLVWTDLLQNAAPGPAGKWVPLRLQGQWGVYAVYDRVTIPTPGRSARMCTSLDPARDLSGWSR